jgi:hypothetical protein
MAYARHYDKRLVTESEWNYVVSDNSFREKILSKGKTYKLPSDTDEVTTIIETHTHMMQMDEQPDSRGTDMKQHEADATTASISTDNLLDKKNLEKDIKEWVTREDMDQGDQNITGTNKKISNPSLIVSTPLRTGLESKRFRYPWEAFSDVGFRCAQSLGNE